MSDIIWNAIYFQLEHGTDRTQSTVINVDAAETNCELFKR